MANRNLNARQQQKHDTSSSFNSKNATYLEAEILVESDTGRVKIGDGDTDYKTLPYTIGTRVPTDAKFTDTTYTNGAGLSLSGTTFSITNTGVTADDYGPTSNITPAFGASFIVPSVSVNSRGQITSAANRTITLPRNISAGHVITASTDSWADEAGPINAAKINFTRSPKTAFMPPEAINIEYSKDAGKTWIDYGVTETGKRQLFALLKDTAPRITFSKETAITTNESTRVTITASDRYIGVNQLVVWISTSGHNCVLDIEISKNEAPDTFTYLRKDVPISGWSGISICNFPALMFGANSASDRINSIRITFKISSVTSGASPWFSDIRLYGDNTWSSSDNMTRYDSIYSWDYLQNVNFPAQIKEQGQRVYSPNNKPTPSDIGAEPAFGKNTAFNKNFGSTAGTVCEGDDARLSNARPASDVSAWAKAATKPTYTPTEVGVIGTAPTSGQVAVFDGTTGKIKSTGFTIASSVPAGAKFTDTTYSKATASSLGLVQVGYETSGKNYAVTLDTSGNAYVNVPWTDTNTTYSQATSGTLGLIKIGYTESGKNYPVELNASGQAFVNVPWTDSVANNPAITITQNGVSKGSFTLNQTAAETITLTDTTYSVFKAATASAAGGTGLVPAPDSGEQTSFLRGDGTWAVPAQPTVNNPTITIKQAGTTKGIFTLNQSGAATIELTDNNTTYNVVSTSANGLAPKLSGVSTTYLSGSGTWTTPKGTVYAALNGGGLALNESLNSFYIDNTGVTSGSYGPRSSQYTSSDKIPIPYITINSKGQITAAIDREVTIVILNASTSKAGLLPKLSGDTSTFLCGDGTWATTSFSGGTVSGATTFSSNVTINGELNYDGGFY